MTDHPPQNDLREWLRPVLIPVILAFGAALISYFPALQNELFFDDTVQVKEMWTPDSVGEWLGGINDPWWHPDKGKTIWRPVTRLTILAEKALADALGVSGEPFLFRLCSLLLHAFGSALVVLLIRTFGVAPIGCAIAGIIAAVHPLRAEGVHQAVGQAESLAAIFMILGATQYMFVRRKGSISAITIVIQTVLFALAIGAKEHAILYPFYIFLIEIDARRNSHESYPGPFWIRVMILGGCFALILGGFFAGKAHVTGGLIESSEFVPWYENALAQMSFFERLPAVVGIFGYAVSQFFLPLSLSPDYSGPSFPYGSAWSWPMTWFGLVVMFGLVGYMIYSFTRRGRAWAFILAGSAAFALTSNLFFTIGVAAALRLWYFPLVFAAIGVGLGFNVVQIYRASKSEMTERTSQRTPILVFVAIVVLYISASWNFAPAWRSEYGWGTAAVAKFPDQMRGHQLLAIAAYKEKRFGQGFQHAQAVVKAEPFAHDGWDMLGLNAMFLEGHAEYAEQAFRRAIEIEPGQHLYYRHLASVLGLQGRHDEARPYMEKFEELATINDANADFRQ